MKSSEALEFLMKTKRERIKEIKNNMADEVRMMCAESKVWFNFCDYVNEIINCSYELGRLEDALERSLENDN